VLWALPFAALSPSRSLRIAAVVMTCWLAFVWSGLGPDIGHAHGLDLRHTPVGQANHRFTSSLLSNRSPTSAQPGHTRRRRP
jgi:hypothetical protein